ncbi:5-oxoprolinase subunit PxpB [Roseivirga pacifica]|uniref:5-oxoprolinase subunit PxpB n=1 Tax=Roseivirga pacifica TaxID=1267423 RepID=UPI003BAED1B9
MMKLQPYGDSALLVSFEKRIDPAISQQVIALHKALKDHAGITFSIPAYQSLTLGFNSTYLNYNGLEKLVKATFDQLDETTTNSGRKVTIPVCYDGAYAPDMSEVSSLTGCSKQEIIQLHTSHEYHVYMLGFVAGFAYMGTLPEALKSPRKETPRLKVHQGAVGLAGLQTGIYPAEAPGGWQIIGTTPMKMFDPEKEKPNFLEAGDKVNFRAISEDEYKIIQLKIETEIFEPEISNG